MAKKKNYLPRSSSNWEDSYFGGYEKVLWDYPEIKTPFEIKTELPSDRDEREGLGYYAGRKLSALFMMKVVEYKFESMLLENATPIEINHFLGNSHYIKAAQNSIRAVVNCVADKDSELANMFLNYIDVLVKSDFLYPYDPPQPPEKNKKGKGEGKEEGKGNNSSDKEKEEEKKDDKGNNEKPPLSDKKPEEKKEDSKQETGQKEKQEEGERDDIEEMVIYEKAILKSVMVAKQEATKLMADIKKRVSVYNIYSNVCDGHFKKNTVFQLMPKRIAPCIYARSEVLAAGQLVDMLDISFDPQSDRVGNLKSGKIDTGKLGSVPAGNHHIYYKIEENQSTKPFSVCILGDESGSMEGENRTRQHSVMKILYKAFSQIIPSNKLFIYGHSGYNFPEVRIYNDNYNQMFEETIDGQHRNKFEQNYDGPIVENIYERIRGVTSDNIIFISISDGEPSGYGYGGPTAIDELKRIIEKCKRDGFVTVGVGLRFGAVKEIYQYHTIVTDMSTLVKKVALLVNQVVKTEFQA